MGTEQDVEFYAVGFARPDRWSRERPAGHSRPWHAVEAHRPPSDLDALRDLHARIGLGIGVVDIKINRIETPDEIAGALERAERVLGPGRVRYAHPDCGLWMLKRSVADRKIAALVKGRDLYLGHPGRHANAND